MRRVRFTRSARQQVKEAQAWWLENRDKAPTLFVDELEYVLTLIARLPGVGVEASDVRLAGVRRVLLPRTRYAVYYRIARRGGVEVLALWQTQRGSGPEL